jgi:TolA-binding protein
MSTTDQPTGDGAPYVQLFQKAHQKIVLLERLEEQLAQMIAKRQDLQEELRIVQRHINEELEQRINVNGESPARILNNVAGSAARSTSPSAQSVAAPVVLDRFASQSITSMAGE